MNTGAGFIGFAVKRASNIIQSHLFDEFHEILGVTPDAFLGNPRGIIGCPVPISPAK
jgi:hypothetical protein